MSNTALFLLCHGSADAGLFVVGYVIAMVPISVGAGFAHAFVKFIKELDAARVATPGGRKKGRKN